jgi:hypothetical protein
MVGCGVKGILRRSPRLPPGLTACPGAAVQDDPGAGGGVPPLEEGDMHWGVDVIAARCVEKMLDLLAGEGAGGCVDGWRQAWGARLHAAGACVAAERPGLGACVCAPCGAASH